MLRTIRAKLLAAFGAVLALLLLITTVASLAMLGVKDATHLQTRRNADHQSINQTQNMIAELYSHQADLVINDNAGMIQEYRQLQRKLEANLATGLQLLDNGDERSWYQELVTLSPDYFHRFDEVARVHARQTELGEAQVRAEYRRLDDLTDVTKARMFELCEKLSSSVEADAKSAQADLDQRNNVALWTIIGVSLLALVSGVGIALGFAAWMCRGVGQIAQAADGIAGGELEHDITFQSQDELGQMATTFARMIAYLKEIAAIAQALSQGDLTQSFAARSERDQLGTPIASMTVALRDIVTQITAAADSVGAGALQISSSSTELSKASATQASSAEETSAAMEEMSANIKSVDASAQTVGTRVNDVRTQSDQLAAAVTQTSSAIAELAASIQQVAGNAQHANEASTDASRAATEGEDAVKQTISGMEAISTTMGSILSTIQTLDTRSGEIGAIIEVIDDIAEQTNLLALNAAIEAARAGEAGRGFAVVADEVRKLAERSAKATSEIAALIKGIQRETSEAVRATQAGGVTVQEGSQLAARTGQALSRIMDASGRVASLLGDVTVASREQARASEQIVAASEQMSNVNREVGTAIAEIDHLTQNVTYATGEQRQGADQVVIAVEHLNRSAQEASTATDHVMQAADDLSAQAHRLREVVGFFRLTAAPGSAVATVPARVPALPRS